MNMAQKKAMVQTIYILENLHEKWYKNKYALEMDKMKQAILEQIRQPQICLESGYDYNNLMHIAENESLNLGTTPLEELAITVISEVNPFIRQKLLPAINVKNGPNALITGQFIGARIRKYWSRICEGMKTPKERTQVISDIKRILSNVLYEKLPSPVKSFFYIERDCQSMIEEFTNLYDWDYRNAIILYSDDPIEENLEKIHDHLMIKQFPFHILT